MCVLERAGEQRVARGFLSRTVTVKHSTQSVSWEEGRQEDVQPDDSQPLHLGRLSSVYGIQSNHRGARDSEFYHPKQPHWPSRWYLSHFLTLPDMVTRCWCCALSSQGSAGLAHTTVIYYGSA